MTDAAHHRACRRPRHRASAGTRLAPNRPRGSARRLLDDCQQVRCLARLGPGDRREALHAAAHPLRVWLIDGLRSRRSPCRCVAPEGSAPLSAAVPARRPSIATAEGRAGDGEGVHRGRSPQAVGDHRGRRRQRRGSWRPAGSLRTRPGMRRCANTSVGIATGPGRWKAATAPAARWRSGCWPMASTWSTSRPSSRPGPGRWTRATTARPTRTTRTRSRWSRCAPRALRVLAYDVQLEALRLLVDRRAELSRARIQCVNRVHRLLSELVPGQSQAGHHHRPGQDDPRHRQAARRGR